MFLGFFQRNPHHCFQGTKGAMEWCSLSKEANGLEVCEPIPNRLLPLLKVTAIISILGTSHHQTLMAFVRSFWLASLSHPTKYGSYCFSSLLFFFPVSCPVPVPPLKLHCKQKPLNCTHSIYLSSHANTMYLDFWFRKCVHFISGIQSIRMKGKSVYIVLWKGRAFLVSAREIRIHENYSWHPFLEPGLYFPTEIIIKLFLVKYIYRV